MPRVSCHRVTSHDPPSSPSFPVPSTLPANAGKYHPTTNSVARRGRGRKVEGRKGECMIFPSLLGFPVPVLLCTLGCCTTDKDRVESCFRMVGGKRELSFHYARALMCLVSGSANGDLIATVRLIHHCQYPGSQSVTPCLCASCTGPGVGPDSGMLSPVILVCLFCCMSKREVIVQLLVPDESATRCPMLCYFHNPPSVSTWYLPSTCASLSIDRCQCMCIHLGMY